ncbi:MAG: NAD(+) synthase [Clostridiales bacterium]|nr:NAD(+) synthase [Clostridiales bacterium]
MKFHKDILKINCEKEANRISDFIKTQTLTMRREGAVIGLSGGVDSAVSAELCVRTLGKEKVFGLILPERESSPKSEELALKQAKKMGISLEIVDTTPTFEAFGTYRKRDEVIKKIFPEYDSSYRFKITLPPDLLTQDTLNFFTLTIDDGKGNTKSARLKKEALNGILAATDTKQRTRMLHLYYFAEKMNYLVCGTTNKSEMIQGFFVKYGDGGVDIEPIAHLYKTQVYQLAEWLGIIEEIIQRKPSPDTFSFEVSDEEFYFRLPYDKLDLLLYAWENKIPFREIYEVMGLSENRVSRVFRDFNAKYNATQHLRRLPPTVTIQ